MRYLPHTEAHRKEMLAKIGVDSINALYKNVDPTIYQTDPVDLPCHTGEMSVEQQLVAMAEKNLHTGQVPSFLGAGAYRHHIPATVDHLIQRGEFLTSYTPYQPEVSQGTLQYLFEFQTQVALITGMDVANASMYDGSTACVEAILMARRITGRRKAIVSSTLHPQYIEIAQTHAHMSDFEVAVTDAPAPDNKTSCVVVQYPDFYGNLQDFTDLAQQCHDNGALLVVVVTEIIALGALKSPGAMNADIVVAEGQSLGNPLGFGGPYVGLFATRDKYIRQLPGRLVGETQDADGQTGYVLTLATREQHIRREKATSNICTNAGLCALAFTIHLSLLGEEGFQKLARLNHAKAVQLADALEDVAGVVVVNNTFFNEFTVKLPKPAAGVVDALIDKGVLAGVPVSHFDPAKEDWLLVAATELTTDEDIQTFTSALKEVL